MTVLLMVFAAVLGATFVTVVSLNLSQTQRAGSKAESQRAALAGLQFIDDQLVANGLAWRPKGATPPPMPGDAEFRFYYNEFDRAQGWATTGTAPTSPDYERDGFVKFPDPRAEGGDAAAHFMARVERIRSTDSDNADGTRTGALRVTVIGRAADDIAAFTRLVRYKAGMRQNILGGAMRTVTNWDFRVRDVPHGDVSAVAGQSITLKNVRGNFPDAGFAVMIGDPQTYAATGNLPRAVVVQNWNAATKTLTLAQPISPIPVLDERIELAAILGAPSFINYNSDNSISTASTSGEFAIFPVAGQNTGGNALRGGVRVNGGLCWMGDVRTALRSTQTAPGDVDFSLRSSGLMQVTPPQTPVTSGTNIRTALGTSSVRLNAEYRSDSGATRTLTNVNLAPSSADTSFPGAWTNASVALSAREKAQIADDGWNRMAGTPSAIRSVAHAAPPAIDAEQWRSLSRDSSAAAGRAANSARWGYGQGIYIDNRSDRERIGTGPSARDMSAAEFRQMIFDDTGPSFTRAGTPASPADATKSLEEKHLRGWIGPDEFRARGVLVEINADATLTITRDTRDDANSQGLSSAQGWRDENGLLLGDTSLGGVYTQTFAWPENGVLFAEGNIRVRGVANNPPRSLSIVSMGRIYIEGSTALKTSNGTTRKLLLMAHDDVLWNPTAAVLSRLDVQTRVAATTTGAATQIPLYDVNALQVGDWVFFDNPNTANDAYACIRQIDRTAGAAGTLTLDRTIASQPVGRAVRTESDPLFKTSVGGSELDLVATERVHLERFGQAVQRRFDAAVAGEVRIALKHSAERREAITVRYRPSEPAGMEPAEANLGFKLAANAGTSVVNTAEKWLTVSDGSTELNRFGVAALASGEKTTEKTLNWLNKQVRDARVTPNWRYSDTSDFNFFNNYQVEPPRIPPYFFLAAVGNRKAWSTSTSVTKPTSTTTWPFRERLKGGWATAGYRIPMATSVALHLNGIASDNTAPDGKLGIRNDIFNSATNDWERVGQFGFNPRHGLEDGAPAPEDILTAEQSFYTGKTAEEQTLDTRVLTRAQAGRNTLALRLNETSPDGGTLADFFNATSATAHIPYYRLHRLKLESAAQLNAAAQFETLVPAATLEINAYVYAQNGSWLVVPGTYFDDTLGNTNSAYTATNDLNHDGVLTRAERVAGYRFHRYNYALRFSGAICEGRAATVFNAGSVKGQVADWMDKWVTTSIVASNWTDATAGSTYRTTTNGIRWTNGNFGNIVYTFDDSLARGALEDDSGFRLPVEAGFLAEN